ncbi:MAG: BrnT family toxin [Hyphomicrobiaceae bacterium]
MISDRFEWDDEKARIYPIHHNGVTFEDAARVFDDLFAVGREDRREDYGEDRFIQIGVAGDRLLTVVYTMRGERIRIISARKAEPFERRWYHEENG